MEINSLQQYMDVLEKLKSNYTYTVGNNLLSSTYEAKFIYRGHGNHASYDLLPGVFRWKYTAHGQTTIYSQLEYNILTDFISEACRYMPGIPEGNIVAWLEIAQHFGVPTRLLDFTENPLIALYFACCSLSDVEASVWVINEPEYKRKFFDIPFITESDKSEATVFQIVDTELVNKFHPPQNAVHIPYPWIYKPRYREERMNTQASQFMIWGAKQGKLTDFMQPSYYMRDDEDVCNKETGIICSILIPASEKRKLLSQLDICGVNEKTVYPGLDGVGRYIQRKYSSKYKY